MCVAVRAYARVDDGTLAGKVEASLKKLGYSYLKNKGLNVTEYEVQVPCHFLVTVENVAKSQFGYPLRRAVRVEAAVDFKRTIGTNDSAQDLKRSISALVEEVLADLPDQRWKGLESLRSMAERETWERSTPSLAPGR